MANPVLNERALKEAGGWAAPQPGTAAGEYYPPVHDGPVSTWRGAMTVNGTLTATATLFVLLLVSAAVGWYQTGGPDVVDTATGPELRYTIPAMAWAGVIVGVVCAIALWFRPMWAQFLGPIYALAQGFFLGAISRMYETFYDGIVVMAAGVTLAVFAVMLGLYRTGIIRVTDRFRQVVITATLGIMAFYGVCLLIRLFAGADAVTFLSSSSLISIGFSVLVAGLAALNLALDFDFIERGTEARLDKRFEWFAAFGLLVTIVWLYLEILRLLAKLRER